MLHDESCSYGRYTNCLPMALPENTEITFYGTQFGVGSRKQAARRARWPGPCRIPVMLRRKSMGTRVVQMVGKLGCWQGAESPTRTQLRRRGHFWMSLSSHLELICLHLQLSGLWQLFCNATLNHCK